jgi:hypothetical protein
MPTILTNNLPKRYREARSSEKGQCGVRPFSALTRGMARLGTHGVLRVASSEGSSYCFGVSQGWDPGRPDAAEHRPGESLVDELFRRGGLLRRGRDVLDEIDRHEDGGNRKRIRRRFEPD